MFNFEEPGGYNYYFHDDKQSGAVMVWGAISNYGMRI